MYNLVAYVMELNINLNIIYIYTLRSNIIVIGTNFNVGGIFIFKI